ncbi:hypothetical protein [Empedobacter tilapiae]|uniref:GLPGLI family protein n=1 Tax=Empedobacter tilapiae TaxID=2491114 RepID=A0A4Z1BJK3_9FLAO|nr:hypothetical protein [Empedobacter tilapiae]TGN30101.1 hypothetical protein E4J94_00565 [Empedobacter tilapiae]
MKKSISFILIILTSFTFAQMQSYKFENVIQYRIKSDFYSDFLDILSTKDYKTHLMITRTPMGNFASLKVNDNMYSVYSEEKNPKVFKIDFEGTKDLLGNTFLVTDNPSLTNSIIGNKYVANRTGQKETILNQKCEVFNIFRKDNNNDDGTEICIDTNSNINTVPFINSELNLKGLIYRVGHNIVLENVETLQNWIKKSAGEEEVNISPNDFIYQFDEKTELEEYRNEYKKQKQ